MNETTKPPVNGDRRSDRRGGFYFRHGLAYPSVTQVVSLPEKFGLTRWKQQMVYRAVIADPTISETEALAAPDAVSEKARNRGTAVHSIIEAIKRGNEPEVGVLALQPFVQAFKDWRTTFSFEFVDAERTVFNETEQYAGTLDLLIKPQGSEQPIVVDIKTGKANGTIYPEAHLQVSAYVHALREAGEAVAGAAVLLLKENGRHKYETVDVDEAYPAFLALKTAWEWYHRDEIEFYESETSGSSNKQTKQSTNERRRT